MFEPFFKEDKVLEQKPFVDYEVQFNLFYRIIDEEEVLALKTIDNNAIALQNLGFPMWLWINETLEEGEINKIINSLCIQLKDSKLRSISGEPRLVKIFADRYSKFLGASNKIALQMEAYQCTKVIKPKNVQGKLIKAESSHKDIVLDFWIEFIFDCFGVSAVREKQIPAVKAMIEARNLYLWEVDNKICAMVNVAHKSEKSTSTNLGRFVHFKSRIMPAKSKGYARIDNVYTPYEERKKGYASAMVSELSLRLIKEGLIPMLYADIKNPDSNKVYKSIGFIESGRIDNIVFLHGID